MRDLIAHLVVREGSPAALGVAVPKLGAVLERARVRRSRGDFSALVDQLEGGPPRLSVFAVPGADRLLNTTELFIHHEDIRRAQRGWEPRVMGGEVQDALWRQLKVAGRLAVLRAGVAVVAERAETGDRTTLKRGDPAVTVRGAPAEVLLFLHGRRDHAHVELLGDQAGLSALRSSRLGV